jgi:hypothetical protein
VNRIETLQASMNRTQKKKRLHHIRALQAPIDGTHEKEIVGRRGTLQASIDGTQEVVGISTRTRTGFCMPRKKCRR